MFRTLDDSAHAVTIEIDGELVQARTGEAVAAVILRQRGAWSRLTPISGAPRAPYCMMGVCFDCLAEVDGANSVQTCLTEVREGMVVRRQLGRPGLTA